MSSGEQYEDTRTINLIVQKRVRENRCMDCGKPLLKTDVGYCKNSLCGQADTKTTYTDEEYSKAKDLKDKLRRKK